MVRSIKGSLKVRKINEALETFYGQRKKTKKFDPLEKLLMGMLSYCSSEKEALKAYENLQKEFVDLNEVRVTTLYEIEEAIKGADPQRNKALLLRRVLNDIFAVRSAIDLDFLRDYRPAKGRKFLQSIGGLDEKTINDVLLVCQDSYELPRNEDLIRVAKRIGIIDKNAAIDDAYAELKGIVPKNLVYSFTQLMVEHGQKMCTEHNCADRKCPLRELCDTYRAKKKERRQRG